MFKKIFSVIVILVTLASCAAERSEMGKQKDRVYQNHLKKMIATHNVRVSSFGGGGNGKQYHLMCLGVDTKEQLTIGKSRRLIVGMVNDLLYRVNNTDGLQSYLVTRPFKSENIDYWLNSVDTRGSTVEYPRGSNINDDVISYVVSSNGFIKYYLFVSMDDDIIKIHSETFDEAVEILRQEVSMQNDKGSMK